MYEVDDNELTIDVGALFGALWRKFYVVLLTGILAALAAFAFTMLFVTPKYTSTTSMYMLTKSSAEPGVTSNDLQTGTQLTRDYMELTKSRSVLEQVIASLNLDMTADELERCITTSNPDNTRILTIEVENEDPELARNIADALRETASNMIKNIMDIDAVNTIEAANLPDAPSSPSLMKNVMIGALLGITASAAVIVLIFILDDTLKTPDDVERYLGLKVLTSVPLQEGRGKAGKTKKRSAAKRRTKG